MKIKRQELIAAGKKIGIPQEQTEKLWEELHETSDKENFGMSKLLFYLGSFLVILAMTWFVGEAFENLGGQGIFWIALIYISLFLKLGTTLWHKDGFRVPGGLLITLAVCIIPLAVYGLQKWSGIWNDSNPGEYQDFFSWIKGGWFLMELMTVLGGFTLLHFYRFPFLTMPIFFALWFMSMDIVPFIFGDHENIEEIKKYVTVVFGLGMLVVAYFIDLKNEENVAFWPYFFGVLTFWSGLTWIEFSSEYTRLLYLFINIGLLLLSVILKRKVFLVFGFFGILVYLSTLYYNHFLDTLSFPIALSIMGIFILFCGILYQKKHLKIEAKIMGIFPKTLESWIPKR